MNVKSLMHPTSDETKKRFRVDGRAMSRVVSFERDDTGIQLIATKRMPNKWQALVSLTRQEAIGTPTLREKA